MSKDVLSTVIKGTRSENTLVRDHSFSLLSKQTDLHGQVSEAVLCDRILRAFQDRSLDLGEYGFKILDSSKLGPEKEQDILIRVILSKHEWVAKEALARLTLSRDAVLPRILARIESKPAEAHRNELRLIEHWGNDAKSAVPVLIGTQLCVLLASVFEQPILNHPATKETSAG